jgi:hypothetical protein
MNSKNKSTIKKLYDYTWGLGIEHEMHIFHKPKESSKNIVDYTLFDSYSAVQRILEDKENSLLDISYDDYEFLKNNVPFETSGRRCNDKWVIKTVPVKMPEFITNKPFCSLRTKNDIKRMTKTIIFEKERFYNLLMLDKNTKKLVKKYGALAEYPYGMTRYLKCPLNDHDGKYIFEKNSDKKPLLVPEYNGSYHITFTLPYKENIKKNIFIKMHQNFCNQLQWLEPLLLTSYFTGDEYAPGSLDKRVRGSFRVMIIGWGNFAGTDVRLLKEGIGRYAKTPTYWREGLKFIDVDKLKPCYKPSPMALKEGATSSLSSDFRTFGSTDPLRPMHRESGIGMTVPNGVEFRIFDHFSDKYIDHLLMLISLVAENSRVTETKGYVYENDVWIDALHTIMKDGYKAKLSKKYIDLLRKKLGLKINTKSIVAFDIFKKIYKELWEKNIDGIWTKIFHCNKIPLYDDYIIPEINKKGWQFAFMNMANNDKNIMNNFNKLSDYINKNKIVSYKDFSLKVIDLFGANWANDIEDIAYLYETSFNYKNIFNEINIKLIKNIDDTLSKIEIINPIKKIENFNDFIIDHFSEDLIKNKRRSEE